MKLKEIALINGFNQKQFEAFMHWQKIVPVTGFNSDNVAESDVPNAIQLYKDYLDSYEKTMNEELGRNVEYQKRLTEENKARDEAVAKMLISSGFQFDGYKIVKYSGYISGDDATQIPRSGIFGGNNGQNLTDALVKIRIQALKELKEAAYALGCNAVVGVDFDYLTLEPETYALNGSTRYEPYVICVTANGNAVLIEKE